MDAITSTPQSAPVGSGEPADGEFFIAELRAELGLTQEEFGARIGLANKASVSLLESRRREQCSVDVALAIEALSVRADLNGGAPRIDAARLNEDVRKARHGLETGAAEADNRG